MNNRSLPAGGDAEFILTGFVIFSKDCHYIDSVLFFKYPIYEVYFLLIM
jgi:hypothetical protein